jgi:trigger factor
VAQKHISQERVYDHAIRDLLPGIYEEIVKKEDLKPVINPKIDLKQAKPNEDWIVVFTLAQRPTVKLADYKKVVQNAKKDTKAPEIWVPGSSDAKEPPSEQEKAAKQQQMLNSILTELLKQSEVEIADVIVEEELNQRLARLVDDVQKLGMTVESYLKSKQTTIEDLQAAYKREIEETHKIELILNEIAEAEKIQVEQAELDKLFAGVTDEKELKAVQQNAYYYAMILRKQKTLDFLLGL